MGTIFMLCWTVSFGALALVLMAQNIKEGNAKGAAFQGFALGIQSLCFIIAVVRGVI